MQSLTQPLAPQPKPELPNPAALQGNSQEHFAAAPREFHAAQPAPPPIAAPMPPRAISEILEPHAAPPRAAIAPELPPDHPLEPGTRPAARMSSPSERIAASESAISEIRGRPEGAGQFIELHRRRAPRRAGRRRRAASTRRPDARQPRPRQGQPRAATRPRRDGNDSALEHHLQDPLAAGRRERGRDRARHLQDGDDAARHRQRAADAADGKFGRAGRARRRRPRRTAPSPRCRRPPRPR